MSLTDQPWYFGNMSKQQVAEMMQSEPDGSFLVRDASTPGDYTLTIRYQGHTKLVRIHVSNGRCGFSPDALTHRSVVGLIDFHRVRSLKVYNENLDTSLRYPVCRRKRSDVCSSPPSCSAASPRVRVAPSNPFAHREPLPIVHSQKSPPTHQPLPPLLHASSQGPEWQLKLGLEKLRISQTSLCRARRLFDLSTDEIARSEDLSRKQTQALLDVERKLEIMRDVREVQETSKWDEEADGTTTLQKTMKNNQIVLQKYIEALENERAYVKSQKEQLDDAIEVLKVSNARSKDRVMRANTLTNECFSSLRNQGLSADLLNDAAEKAQVMLLQAESLKVSQILGDLPLNWGPSRYLVNECTKDGAASLIQQARARLVQASKAAGVYQNSPQGIFLIRPSGSQPNKLVLSVLHGERISHCLIEQTEQGWGFENGGLYFVTIGDFVRYYAHTSLVEHNPDINTCLTCPALSSSRHHHRPPSPPAANLLPRSSPRQQVHANTATSSISPPHSPSSVGPSTSRELFA